MTEHEAALERLKLRPGDIVRITRAVPDYDGGWANTWTADMDQYIGYTSAVSGYESSSHLGVPLNSGRFLFPAHVLELVCRAGESPADRPEVDLLTVLMGDMK